MIVLPIGVEPVKPSFLTSGCSDKAWPIDDPGPGSILITPGGNPALTTSSANFRAVSGVTYQINMYINNTGWEPSLDHKFCKLQGHQWSYLLNI